MYANRLQSKFSVLVTLVIVSLIAAACATTKTTTSPVIATPTRAPAKAQATATTRPLATPAGVAIGKATSTPTAKPTEKPTAKPTVKPATATPKPTAMPTAMATAATTAEPSTGGMKIGTAQTSGDVSILPAKVEMVNSLGTNKPKTGDEYLVVTFTIENKSKTASFAFDPAKLVVKDKSGKTISMATVKSGSTDLAAKTLKPGEKYEGVIVYEVSQTGKPFTLEYSSTGTPMLVWTIS